MGTVLRAQNAGFVYVANQSWLLGQAGSVSAYIINGPTGALTPVPGSPFAVGIGPTSITVDPAGRFVLVVNGCAPLDCSGSVSSYTIDEATGALTPARGSPFSAGFNSRSVAVDSTGHFAYVANSGVFGSRDISAYQIEQETGALTPVPGSPFPAGGGTPTSVAVDPIGQFVYVTCGQRVAGTPDPTISAYTIDQKTGVLTQVSGSPFIVGFPPVSVTVDPTGRFVYVAALLFQSIDTYIIDKTSGALTPRIGFPVNGEPRSVAVDPTGKFLYAAAIGAPGVLAYSIDQTTGALTPISGSDSPIGFGPNSITTTAGPSACGPDNPIGETGAIPPGQRLVPGKRCGRWE